MICEAWTFISRYLIYNLWASSACLFVSDFYLWNNVKHSWEESHKLILLSPGKIALALKVAEDQKRSDRAAIWLAKLIEILECFFKCNQGN